MPLTLGLGVSKFEHLDSGQHCMNPTVPNGLFHLSGGLARERARHTTHVKAVDLYCNQRL